MSPNSLMVLAVLIFWKSLIKDKRLSFGIAKMVPVWDIVPLIRLQNGQKPVKME
jgi:hypothetical protein